MPMHQLMPDAAGYCRAVDLGQPWPQVSCVTRIVAFDFRLRCFFSGKTWSSSFTVGSLRKTMLWGFIPRLGRRCFAGARMEGPVHRRFLECIMPTRRYKGKGPPESQRSYSLSTNMS